MDREADDKTDRNRMRYREKQITRQTDRQTE